MVAAKRGPPLVEPCHRHQFPGLVRRVFEGRGNTVGRVRRPAFIRTQLRGLTKIIGSPLIFPSMLTVRQWASLIDFMVRTVTQERR
jgi:hypothetical protein